MVLDVWMDRWKDGWVGGWVSGWMDGWMGGRAALRIAYSNQKLFYFKIKDLIPDVFLKIM